MSVLDELFNEGMMGEPERLDHIIREHEKLRARVSQLEDLLRSKGILTDEERARLAGPETNRHVPAEG